jgi:hypothetical protein
MLMLQLVQKTIFYPEGGYTTVTSKLMEGRR